MKTYIDLPETYKGLFLTSKRLKNRLIRYWGTTTIDGVDVFIKRFQVWPGTTNTSVKKVLKMFGLWEQVFGTTFEGITSYYLWFNPEKSTELDGITDNILVNKINSLVVQDEPFIVNLNFTNTTDPLVFAGMSKTQIYDYVTTNYATLVDDQYIEARADTMTQEAIALYILLDDGSHFDVELLSATVTPVEKRHSDNDGVYSYSRTVYETGITVELKVTQTSNITANNTMITKMLEENDQLRQRKIATLAAASTDTETFDWVSDDESITDAIWYKGHLRVQTTDSYYLDRDDFTKLITTSIDTGYVKKKTKWYKKLLAIVVVVVAFWLSGGFAATTFASLATSLGITSLVLAGIQLVLSQSGDNGFAQYFGKIAQVVGYVATITGISAFIQNLGKNVLFKSLQEAANQGIGQVFEFAAETAISRASAVVTEFAAAVSRFVAEASISNALDVLGTKFISAANRLLQKIVDMRISTAKQDIRDLQDQVKQSQEELNDITDKEIHLGVEDIRFYTKPLTFDNIIFETDYLYEGTKMNVGRPSFYPYGLNLRDKQA